jgi:contractile injection system tube protein
MPNLEKAKLFKLDRRNPNRVDGDPIPVQFNPASMHFVLSSTTDGPGTPARQAEQSLGAGNLTLTLDLHFDTADEGATDAPHNVRLKTAQVAQFMQPTRGSREAPPRVRFAWGDFQIDGVMGSYTEDVDLFSPQGVPLRAKVSISIRGQNPDVAANRTGAGVATGAGATTPGGGGGGGAVGTIGFGASLSVGASLSLAASVSLGADVTTGVAIGGESAAEFAARMGVDPGAWRGIAGGLDSTVSIEAGTEIDVSAGLSSSAGVGAATGVEASAAVPLDAAVGLAGERAAPQRSGAAPGTAAGFALAAAGGVQSAVETVRIADTAAKASGAKEAFALAPRAATPPAAPSAPPAASQPRPPLRAAELPVAAAQRPAPPAPPPPRADARATTFGYGVPLRPRVTGAADERAGAVGGLVLVAARVRVATEAPVTPDRTAAPWLALPAADPGRSAADAKQDLTRPTCSCGCNEPIGRGDCGCGCGGGC